MEIIERTKNVARSKDKNLIESVIGIDTDRELIHFYSAKNGDAKSINYLMCGYKAKPFSPEFYEKVGAILGQYRQDHPDDTMQKVAIVLSDSAVLTDTVNLPPINKKALDSSLSASLTNLYKNSAELKFNRSLALQTKSMATYAVAAMRKDIINNLHKICSQNQVGTVDFTYASAAVTNAAFALNDKTRNGSFVILDIKEEFARIILVCKGKTLGFYTLPFGHKILYKTRITPEDLLFDHAMADLIVLNAKERAKAKNLTLAEDVAALNPTAPTAEGESDEDEDEFELIPPSRRKAKEEEEEDYDELMEEEERESELISRKSKKPARKLPKFMHRPTPTNREGYMYENFRMFVKWTLEVIASNPGVTALGAPETVYVNMPEEYYFLFDVVNEEAEDNGVVFAPLFATAPDEVIKKNLELYGGFFTKQYNTLNDFKYSSHDAVVKPKADDKSGKKPEEKEAPANAAEAIKGVVQKVVDVAKKIASYDLSGGKN